jgi:circadian clock protein KaiB
MAPPDDYALTLYVNGASDRSGRAVASTRHLCDTHLSGRFRLTVLDLHEDPAGALRSGVLAAPTLVRNHPLPVRRFVGDLSRTDEVLAALELRA